MPAFCPFPVIRLLFEWCQFAAPPKARQNILQSMAGAMEDVAVHIHSLLVPIAASQMAGHQGQAAILGMAVGSDFDLPPQANAGCMVSLLACCRPRLVNRLLL